MGGAYYFDDSAASSGMTTGIIVETVMNFGLASFFMLPLIMIALGYALTSIDLALFGRHGNLVYLTAFSVYYWFSTDIFANDLGALVTRFIINSLGLGFLYVLVKIIKKSYLP
jgi:hypothetical protein